MYFKLMCLDRSYFLQRDPQFFESYQDAVAAAGAAMQAVEQGSVIEVATEGTVLLRMRCEKAPGFPSPGIFAPLAGLGDAASISP
jgi:hypothetical protein